MAVVSPKRQRCDSYHLLTGLAFPITFRKARLYSQFAGIPNIQNLFYEFSTLAKQGYGERASNLPGEKSGDYNMGKPDKFARLHRCNTDVAC